MKIHLRKAFILLMLLLAMPVFSVSLREEEPLQEYDSLPMLERFYDENLDSDEAFWDACSIKLLTISKGDPVYSWFGHAALLVEAPGNEPLTYDYGVFSFGDGFYVNFAMGRLWYNCQCTYARYEYRQMELEQRTISAVELNFTAAQKKAIIGFLSENSRPENKVYLYNNYTDNCATRLRDIINYATDGDFEAWARKQSGYTYRQQISRMLANNRIVQWALDLLQGRNIDRQETLWEEMFLPEMLQKAVLSYRDLAVDQYNIIEYEETSRKANLEKPSSNIGFSLLFGLLLAAVTLLVHGFNSKAGHIVIFVTDLLFGLVACLLLFMMCFTTHDYCWFNENAVFVNPFLLVLAFFALSSIKNKKREHFLILGHEILLGLEILLCLVKLVLPGIFFQFNWTHIITFALLYAADIAALRFFNRKN